MTRKHNGGNSPQSTIQETRSPKVFAEKCPVKDCGGQGKIYAAAETFKIDPKTGDKSQRRYVKCDKCGHKWAQDGPPASERPEGEYIAGPCEAHPMHGDGRIYNPNAVIPLAVCDECGHTWRAVRLVEP